MTRLHSDAAVAGDVADAPIPIAFFVRGEVQTGDAVRHRSRDLGVDLIAPEIDYDGIVPPRSELPPLLDVPIDEIIAFLAEAGKRMDLDSNPYLREAMEHTVRTNLLPPRVIENLFRSAPQFLTREGLEATVRANFADPAVLDGWVERTDALGNRGALRAYPPRMIHMLAGNSPTGCISSIAQGALVKAVNVFKMPSSDPFTCVAMLRTMADIDPSHPVVRSMSAVYWRGGDEEVERTLYRPQYFDRIVAWGGGEAIQNVIRYLGPGLQLVSFDPKTSISMIGREAFGSPEAIAEVAELTAADATVFNQDACLATRFVFVEGDREGIEAYCEVLQERLGHDRFSASAKAPAPSSATRDEVETLSLMDEAKVWGKFDGAGLVVLTEDPVGFHPSNKTVNVVHLPALEDAVRFVNVATQTVGVYPPGRKADLRDRLASAGAQRVVRLGGAARHVAGSPHDAMFPLQRFVHWISDEDAVSEAMF